MRKILIVLMLVFFVTNCFGQNYYSDKQMNDIRNEFTVVLTEYLKNHKYAIKCTNDNSILIIKIEKIFNENIPSNYVLDEFLPNLAYSFFKQATTKYDIFDSIKTMFDGVVFKFDFQFNNYTTYRVNKIISKENFPKIYYPINKDEFKNLLQ